LTLRDVRSLVDTTNVQPADSVSGDTRK